MKYLEIYNKLVAHNPALAQPDLTEVQVSYYLNTLEEKGLIYLLHRSYYLPADITDNYRVASNAVENGCLSYLTALEYALQLTEQSDTLFVHSSKSFSNFNYQDKVLKFAPMKRLINPVEVFPNSPFPIRLTSIEQTLVSCMARPKFSCSFEALMDLVANSTISTPLSEKDLTECLALERSINLYRLAETFFSEFKKKFKISNNFIQFCHELKR